MFWSIFLETLGAIAVVLVIAYICYRLLHKNKAGD